MMNDCALPSFWEKRYQAQQTPWDFHGVPAAFKIFLSRSKPSRVLVPGCGSGYEVKAFLDHGWDAYGIDFSPTAVQQARKLLDLEKKEERILQGDFFSYAFQHSFDFIYERTFLCALPLRLRMSYAKRIRELLLPCGRLVGYFFYGEKKDGPPYALKNLNEAKKIFAGWQLRTDLPVNDSVPVMAGGERWQEWEKNSA